MNKGDLINEVAKIVSTKKEAQKTVDCIFSIIKNHTGNLFIESEQGKGTTMEIYLPAAFETGA